MVVRGENDDIPGKRTETRHPGAASSAPAVEAGTASEIEAPEGVKVASCRAAILPRVRYLGLDVGSTRFVHEQLLALRAAGSAVLLVSTELGEVLALADRSLALVGGRLVPVPETADRGQLGAILLGEGAG